MPSPDRLPTVALLGARGAVGRLVAGSGGGLVRLRPGARSPAGNGAVVVSPRDPAGLRSFLDGTDLVVNCLGPGFRTRGQVAAVAAGAGVPYLDPNGDDAIHARIAAAVPFAEELCLVTGAGAVPGAFGLLGRRLMELAPGPVHQLRGYLVTREPMHAGTAAEFLLGVLTGSGSAPDTPTTGIRLPYVDGELEAHPLVTTESAGLAALLHGGDARFFHAFGAGDASLRYLRSLSTRAGAPLRELAEELAATVNAEQADRPAQQVIAFEARGDGFARSVVLRSPSSYRVTAAVVLLAALEILAGRVRPGLHRADVLDPSLIERLTTVDGDIRVETWTGPLADRISVRPAGPVTVQA